MSINIITLKNNLEPLQIKAWSWLLYNANRNLKFQDTFTIPLAELTKGISYKDGIESLKKLIFSLTNSVIKSNFYEKTLVKKEKGYLLPYCRIYGDTLTYRLSYLITEKLADKQMYKKINMLVQNQLNFKYAKIIYGLCLNCFDPFSNQGSVTVKIEQLRIFLGLKDYEYPSVGEMKRSILTKTAEDINKSSNLHISLQYLKEGKNIVAVVFNVSINSENLIPVPGIKDEAGNLINIIHDNQELKNYLEKNKISVSLIKKSVSALLEAGISAIDIGKYFLYIKALEEGKETKARFFFDNLVQKINMENFFKMLASKQFEHQEDYEKKLHKLYQAHEMIKVMEYLKERKALLYKLLDKNDNFVYNPWGSSSGNMAVRILKLALDFDELVESFTIAEVLLPDVIKMPDYNYISFEEWRKNYLQKTYR
jgi:hypothetical protein